MSEPTNNFVNQLGFLGHYALRCPVSTTFSESGSGHEVGLSVTVNPTLKDRYVFKLSFPWGETQGNITTYTEGPGTYTVNSRWSGMVGMGHHRRIAPFYKANGNIWGSVFSLTLPALGVGTVTSGLPDRDVDGEEFTFDDNSVHTFDLSTQYAFGIEFLVNRFNIMLAPTLNYGVYFHESGSEWNRMHLEFMITAALGYGDKSTLNLRPRTEASGYEIAYHTYAKLNGIIQSILMMKTLNEMYDRLGDFDFDFGGEDPGSTEDLRILQGASAFMGGMGQASSMEYFLSIGNWNVLPMVLEALGGVLVMATGGGESGFGSGTGSLLNAFGMSIYMMWGIDTPAERLELREKGKYVYPKLLGTALIRYGINTLAFLAGILLVNNNEDSDFGNALLSGGGQANFGVAFGTAPHDSEAVDRTTYSYIPATFYNSDGSNGSDSGSRSGILIQHSWHKWPVFTEARFLSHGLRLDNLFKRMGVEPGEPYGDDYLPSEVAATLGAHYEHTYFRIGGGLDTAILFGSRGGSTAALGLSLGADVLIPFNGRRNGTGLTFGVRGSVHKYIPDGWAWELTPHLGLTAHF